MICFFYLDSINSMHAWSFSIHVQYFVLTFDNFLYSKHGGPTTGTSLWYILDRYMYLSTSETTRNVVQSEYLDFSNQLSKSDITGLSSSSNHFPIISGCKCYLVVVIQLCWIFKNCLNHFSNVIMSLEIKVFLCMPVHIL